MHWEKIPMNIGGKDAVKERLEELDRARIPVRFVRIRKKKVVKCHL
jgi:hypothetical protein